MSVLEELGIKGMINAGGTYTSIGGSSMSDETLAAMDEARSTYVFIRDLQKSVHEKLAEITHNEAAYVCDGAATGVYLAVAAATGLHYGKNFNYLTKEQVYKTNVVMYKAHRNPYDQGVKDLGIEYRELGYANEILPVTEKDLFNAIDENTTCILFVIAGWLAKGGLDFETTIKVAKQKNIPVIVDAAAQLPYVENLWKINEAGAVCTIFSGGKELRGPQASGLITGQKKFVDEIASIGFPNYGIGRKLKVGREEICGLYAAVKQYVNMDHEKHLADCEMWVKLAIEELNKIKYFTCAASYPNEAGQPMSRVLVHLNEGVKFNEIYEYMLSGEDRIYINSDDEDSFYINPMCLKDGEIDIVINKLKAFERK